jgi:hypothetical protein
LPFQQDERDQRYLRLRPLTIDEEIEMGSMKESREDFGLLIPPVYLPGGQYPSQTPPDSYPDASRAHADHNDTSGVSSGVRPSSTLPAGFLLLRVTGKTTMNALPKAKKSSILKVVERESS